MSLEECLEELQSIMDSVTKREIKVKWNDGVVAYYSVEDFTGFPANTVFCSSNDGFFLKAWRGEVWLSSNSQYSNVELFNLLYEASKSGDQLYATSTDVIVKGMRK